REGGSPQPRWRCSAPGRVDSLVLGEPGPDLASGSTNTSANARSDRMSTQAKALIGEPAASPPPADRGPRASLQVLPGVAVLHSLGFLGQPVFAGGYLMGDVDSLTLHDINAFVITGLDLAQLICAVVYFWGGRGRAWPIWASLAVALAVEVQVGMGYERLL